MDDRDVVDHCGSSQRHRARVGGRARSGTTSTRRPLQPSIFEARRTSLNGGTRCREGVPPHSRSTRRREARREDSRCVGDRLRHGDDQWRACVACSTIAGSELQRDLIAFVPINVRGGGRRRRLGNQISGMLVALHTDIVDPVERLVAIAQATPRRPSACSARTSRKMFQDMPRVLGPTVLSLGGKLSSALSRSSTSCRRWRI